MFTASEIDRVTAVTILFLIPVIFFVRGIFFYVSHEQVFGYKKITGLLQTSMVATANSSSDLLSQPLKFTWIKNFIVYVKHAVDKFLKATPRFLSNLLLGRKCKEKIYLRYFLVLETAVAQWLRCCATNRQVAGSIPASVSGFFVDIKYFLSHYGPGVDSASNRNEYQEYFLG